MARGRRKSHEPEHADERWLLTYADMITLLMALFMVMFAMAEVDATKLKGLSQSLDDAFSGKILPGGQSVKETAATVNVETPAPRNATTTVPPKLEEIIASPREAAAEERAMHEVGASVEKEVASMGLQDKVHATVTERGVVIEILTDNLLFDSGAAHIKAPGMELLAHLAPLLRRQSGSRMIVEGHTDSQPMQSSVYPSNWELSTARASAVVRALIAMNLPPARMEASGRAYLKPVASNATVDGRAHNRRVEIVLPRRGT